MTIQHLKGLKQENSDTNVVVVRQVTLYIFRCLKIIFQENYIIYTVINIIKNQREKNY